MNTGVLTLIDILRIQAFVFASNRLKDVAAGSWLVARAADADELAGFASAQAGELVFAAGGNALLAFPDDTHAKAFAATFSRRILDKFPGLDVEMAHQPFKIGEWAMAFTKAQKDLERRKLARKGQAPQLGLSVTAECIETRRVAEEVRWERSGPNPANGHWVPLSATTLARREAVSHAAQQWRPFLTDANGSVAKFDNRELLFPDENDNLGRTHGEMSLLGLVHVDGNGVGKRVLKWLGDKTARGLDNEAFQEAQRTLAREINETATAAMAAVVERVRANLQAVKSAICVRSNRLEREFELFEDKNGVSLPLRPILVGGDDITFLCDGRLALTLARTALEAFAATNVPSFGGPLSACAGIAIVKSHAPFARAYALAEELCRSAKAAVKTDSAHVRFAADASALDWHVGHMTTLEPLESMRTREYSGQGGDTLHMRPYPLTGGNHDFMWLDKDVLGGGGTGFLGGKWQKHRNKIKALRELVRNGPTAVATALANWEVTAGPDVATLPGSLPTGGFIGGATPLLDATELADLHLPLD